MKRVIVVLICCVLLVSWCSRPTPEEETQTAEKQPFFVTIDTLWDLREAKTITKNWTIVWAQAITVSSQVNGRVSSVRMKQGDAAQKALTVVQLADSTGTYSFAAQRAKASLDAAQSSYAQTTVWLEKAIIDSELAIKQAETQANAANPAIDSSTSLQVQQLEQSLVASQQEIDKAEFDLDTQRKSNQQTIQNYINTAKNLTKDVQLLYETVKTESDKLLGETPLYEANNDAYEHVLWVRNTSTKREAERTFRILLNDEQAFMSLWSDFTEENLVAWLQKLKATAELLRPTLDKIDVMLSFTDAWPLLPEAQLSAWIWLFDGLKSQVQGQITAITQQSNGMKSFLSTYEQQEASLARQIDIARQRLSSTESQIQATKRTFEDTSSNSQIGLESAQQAYNTSLKNKQATLNSLATNIQQARVSYNEAQNQLSKFTVTTPIAWVIGEVLVDEGQEVNIGTPLFTMVSNNEQQIEIGLTDDDLQFVSLGDEVVVSVQAEQITWSIQSISKTADANFTYTTTIALQDSAPLLWWLVRVDIPVRSSFALIPINVVKMMGNNEWLINTWQEDTAIVPEKVRFGKVWWDTIELITDLPDTTRIITNNVDNYNDSRHILEVRE